MARLLFRSAPALGALALLLGVPSALAGGGLVEKTVAVPRDTKVPVELSYRGATLQWVESHNDPSAADVAAAERKDPKDRTHVFLRFYYRNDDYVKHRVNVRAVLLADDGSVVGDGGRRGSLDPKTEKDTFSFLMRVKTVDWPKATQLRITATFRE